MTNDIKLCYFGGSGGFILLHLLLLSRQFFCRFDDDSLELADIIYRQWQIPDPRRWKANEHWPKNLATSQYQTNLRKIYFFCNPNIHEVSEFEGQILFLYLDADSQLKMAKFKQAHYFLHEPTSLHENYVSYYRAKLKNWYNHYNNIKDPSWSRCTGPAGFRALPLHIKNELLENPYTTVALEIKKYTHYDHVAQEEKFARLNQEYVFLPDGTKVMHNVGNFFRHADMSIKLTDALNDLNVLSEIIGVAYNNDQVCLRNRWASLHPLSLLDDVGITPMFKSHAEQTN